MKKLLGVFLCVGLLFSFALAENTELVPKEEVTIRATITIKDMGDIVLDLYPQIAPQSVSNFVSLAQKDFYKDVIFHRIIKGFMVQGGDPLGQGTGGPGYAITGEFASNGFKNPLSHMRGVISWARTNEPNSAGSQFFIVHEDSQFLDGQYAAFGRVVEGMDVVDAMAKLPTGAMDRPINPPVIEKIVVDTMGVELAELDELEQ